MARDAVTEADVRFHDATAHLYEATLEPAFAVYDRLYKNPWLRSLPGRGEALDVGCGTGLLTIPLAERGYRVCGVDHSAGMRALAERKAAERGLGGRVELLDADVRSLPYADGRFDVVACQGVLHHLADVRPCLAEIARVLKPGGVFYLNEPCHGATPVTRLLGRMAAEPPAPPDWAPEHDEGPVDAAELTAALDALGLERRVRYWSVIRGAPRLPLPAQHVAVAALSWPWRRRSGDLVVITGRKPTPSS